MSKKSIGAVELGGTKIICAEITDGEITNHTEIPTREPSDSIKNVSDFFNKKTVSHIGVGSFGPLCLDPENPKFGSILNTPKVGWDNFNLKREIEARTNKKVMIDTDVNTAALGEYYYGVAKNIHNFVYITVGTGIGGCLLIDGKPYIGKSNLEMGHVLIQKLKEDEFQGVCPIHSDCLEGLASGLALEKRWGKAGEFITDLKAWDMEAEYIAKGLLNIIYTIYPGKIVIGGGTLDHQGFIEAVREKVQSLNNKYVILPNLSEYIVLSSGKFNGVLGASKIQPN